MKANQKEEDQMQSSWIKDLSIAVFGLLVIFLAAISLVYCVEWYSSSKTYEQFVEETGSSVTFDEYIWMSTEERAVIRLAALISKSKE